MMTEPTITECFGSQPNAAIAQKVVIMNGSPEVLGLLETVLDAGHYDVVFVESNHQAYSQIRLVQPNVVVLSVRTVDLDGFQVLSMLKLDEKTRDIPVILCVRTVDLDGFRMLSMLNLDERTPDIAVRTHAVEYENEETEDESFEPSESIMFTRKPAMQMN